MTPLMLRHLWSIVETTQTQVLLNLDDNNLVQWLLRDMRQEQSLDRQETDSIKDYLHERLPLIRDMAAQR